MKLFKQILFIILLLTGNSVLAQSPTDEEKPETAFQNVIKVVFPDELEVPTVIEVPIVDSSAQHNFLVKEIETGNYIGSYFKRAVEYNTDASIETRPPNNFAQKMLDENYSTYAEFSVQSEGGNMVSIVIDTNEPVTTSQLNFSLADNVALPQMVGVMAGMRDDAMLEIVVSRRPLAGTTITFPEVTANRFEITFNYNQPLRITELNLQQKNITDIQQSLRFLAQPNRSYEIFLNADRSVKLPTMVESGNLLSDEGVSRAVVTSAILPNTLYVLADIDYDGVRDRVDNCVEVFNPDQEDVNKNGRGDNCDDFDRDGVMNSLDNCTNQPNINQSDEDGDGMGDACDEEESRFTERNPWIPWVGMGTAGFVILILFALVLEGKKPLEVKTEDKVTIES